MTATGFLVWRGMGAESVAAGFSTWSASTGSTSGLSTVLVTGLRVPTGAASASDMRKRRCARFMVPKMFYLPP